MFEKAFRKILLIAILMILIVTPYNVQARPHSMDRKFFEDNGEIVWNIKTERKCIVLTFDDGPHPKYTPQILNILKKYNAKATFFIVGENVDKNKEILLRELREGHELGNHTYTHPNTYRISISKLREEVKATHNIIYDVTGIYPKYFRPPGGAFDSEIVSISKEFDYKFILWSWWQDSKDWACPGVDKIVRRVLASPQNGDIVLFHDYVDGISQTPKALEIILPKLKEMGFEFITLSELLKEQPCHE